MAKKIICPLLKKPCIEHDCAWFGHMDGMNPQTGQSIDGWDCVVKWLPILLVDGARQTRNVQAAVETFRNENVDQSAKLNESLNGVGQFMGMLSGVAQAKQIPQTPHVDRLESDGD